MTLAAAYFLDLFFGDPENWPHPVRWIGALIEKLEIFLRRAFPSNEYFSGVLLTISVCGITFFLTAFAVVCAYALQPALGFLINVLLIYTALSVKSLKDSACDVLKNLESGDLSAAKQSVGKIVGRDTDQMSEGEVVRATVETVAENTVDGIVSPLFYAMIGGAPLAMMFKAASTLDSMVGYKNERYRKFGWASAKFDDVLNFIPARLSALLIPVAAWVIGMKGLNSLKIAFRDGSKHPSPNSGIAEAAFAGALGVQLGGINYRNGAAVEYPFLGDDSTLDRQDIARSVKLSLAVSFLWMALLTATIMLVL